jgi:hypothetical protein
LFAPQHACKNLSLYIGLFGILCQRYVTVEFIGFPDARIEKSIETIIQGRFDFFPGQPEFDSY